MRFVEHLLKTLALVVAAVCALVAPAMWQDSLPSERTAAALVLGAVGAVALAAAVGGYVIGNRARRRAATQPVPSTLPFPPSPGQTWLDAAAWASLPDPAPAAPRPKVWADPTMPEVPVPPDEILRRLWLARAHVGTYKSTALASARVGAAWVLGIVFAVDGLLFAYGVDTRLNAVDADERAQGLGGILAGAVFALPVLRLLQVVISDARATFRRYNLLNREIETLEAADARRSSGPLDTSHTGRRATPEVAWTYGLRPALDRAVAAFPQPDGFRDPMTIDGSRGRG
ncbi:hypothetical protein [Streptomyces sp. SID3343]|uniref:hypothetical protein n=1 Tax=Streptomyces sp. SID3343 TaxID=2690260 RepID=UPI0013709A44|nr:hypothetical protein [Streptomyces sp. SID3343]MYW06392.1 hypothetical protein [Streptomyces sp. SID3343]